MLNGCASTGDQGLNVFIGERLQAMLTAAPGAAAKARRALN